MIPRKGQTKLLRWGQLELLRNSAPLERHSGFHTVTAVGRYLYVLGSCPLRTEQYTFISFHVFDLCQKQWSEVHLETGPRQRYGHSANLVDDKIYLFGGYQATYFKALHIYDLALNAWVEVRNSQSAPYRVLHTAHFAEEIRQIFVVCGMTELGVTSGLVYAYGIETKEWVECKAKGQPPIRSLHASCLVGNKIYLSGGCDVDRSADPRLLHVFDFSRGLQLCAWTSITMGGQLSSFAAGPALIYISQGRMLFLGGETWGNHPFFMSLYDLKSRSVETITVNRGANIRTSVNRPTPRRNFGVAHLNNRVLILGGYGASMNPIYELDITALC